MSRLSVRYLQQCLLEMFLDVRSSLKTESEFQGRLECLAYSWGTRVRGGGTISPQPTASISFSASVVDPLSLCSFVKFIDSKSSGDKEKVPSSYLKIIL